MKQYNNERNNNIAEYELMTNREAIDYNINIMRNRYNKEDWQIRKNLINKVIDEDIQYLIEKTPDGEAPEFSYIVKKDIWIDDEHNLGKTYYDTKYVAFFKNKPMLKFYNSDIGDILNDYDGIIEYEDIKNAKEIDPILKTIKES